MLTHHQLVHTSTLNALPNISLYRRLQSATRLV